MIQSLLQTLHSLISVCFKAVHLICPECHSTSHNQNTIRNFLEHFWPAHPHCADQYTKVTWLWDTLWCIPVLTLQICGYNDPIPSLVTVSHLEGWCFLWSSSWPDVSHQFTLPAEEHERPHLNSQCCYLHASIGRVRRFFWFSWFLIRWDKWTETSSKQTQLQPAVTY